MNVLPFLILTIITYGFYKKIDVFKTFTIGVLKGFEIVLKIAPIILGLVTAVYMIRASGAIDAFSTILSPVMNLFCIPSECTPLILLKPISGGGGLAVASELMKTYGVDSYIGRVAAVMAASSETSFYTMSVYFGSLGINKMRYTVYCVLTADFVAFAMSAFAVRLIF